MSKYQIIFLVVTLAILGIFVFDMKDNLPTTEVGKNVEILKSVENMPILAEEVAYFPEADGYFVRPKNDNPYPGVVLIHENRGLRPETKMAAEQLAKDGFLVLAVDLFGKTAETQEEARALTGSFSGEVGVQNMRAAVKFLRDKGATKIASLGWCFGGRQSIELAISGEKLDATVVYYGGGMGKTTDKIAPIKWPVLGIFGDQDQAIPVEMVRDFESSLKELGVENEIYIYPGVGHAFANPSGMNYAPEETKDAWAKTVLFLNTHLK